MSGTKVVSVLSEHNDVFVTGGPVHKLFLGPNSKGHGSEGAEEMVLCAGASYKILTEFAPTEGNAAAGPEMGRQRSASGLQRNRSRSLIAPAPPPTKSAQEQLLLEDPEQALKEAEKQASSKKSSSAKGVSGGATRVLWRTPHSHVLRVSPLADFHQTIAKDSSLPDAEFKPWEDTHGATAGGGSKAPPPPSAAAQRVLNVKHNHEDEAEMKFQEQNAREDKGMPPLPEFGFVIEFFTEKHEHKKLEKYHPTFRFQAHRTDVVAPLACQHLRYRFFSCASYVEQQEWCAMWSAVLTNYWQERFEASIIPEPHVYQFHTWALNKATKTLTQLVVSTTSLYAIPRGTNQAVEATAAGPSSPVATLKSAKLEDFKAEDGASAAIVKLASGSPSSALPEHGYVFFTSARALELVMELQRVWYMNKGQDEPFPLAE